MDEEQFKIFKTWWDEQVDESEHIDACKYISCTEEDLLNLISKIIFKHKL